MNKKRDFFLNLAVVVAGIVIISFVIGGCGKDDEERKPNEDTKQTDTKPELKPLEPEPTEEETEEARERLEKLQQQDIRELTELQEIIINSKGWKPIMQGWQGKDAPDVRLQDIEGKPLKLSDFEGKEVIILKWSTAVEPSRAMLNDLLEIKSGNENLKIIAISTERASQLPNYDEIQNVSLIPGPHKLVEPYRSMRAIPSAVFIGSDGKIKLIATNKIPKDDLEKIIAID